MDEQSDPEPTTPSILEGQHVHQVYDAIAEHFSTTRYKPWPIVSRFLSLQSTASIGIDLGCGNGKNLNVHSSYPAIIGGDRCLPLLLEASAIHPEAELLRSDVLLPGFREGVFDFAISIAVIHHLVTVERRAFALQQMCRLLKTGGQMLIFVWAWEQEMESKRKPARRAEFGTDHGDVMMPWKHKKDGVDAKEYQRYYHLFRKGELDGLLEKTQQLRILESGYDRDNWVELLPMRPIPLPCLNSLQFLRAYSPRKIAPSPLRFLKRNELEYIEKVRLKRAEMRNRVQSLYAASDVPLLEETPAASHLKWETVYESSEKIEPIKPALTIQSVQTLIETETGLLLNGDGKFVQIGVSTETGLPSTMFIVELEFGRTRLSLCAQLFRQNFARRHVPVEGNVGDAEWIVIELGDLMVHIMSPEARVKYSLEEHWKSLSERNYGGLAESEQRRFIELPNDSAYGDPLARARIA